MSIPKIVKIKLRPELVSSSKERHESSRINILDTGLSRPSEERVLKFKEKSLGNWSPEIERCMICYGDITTVSSSQLAQCPHCKRNFHDIHWIEWVKKKGKCPVCKNKVAL